MTNANQPDNFYAYILPPDLSDLTILRFICNLSNEYFMVSPFLLTYTLL